MEANRHPIPKRWRLFWFAPVSSRNFKLGRCCKTKPPTFVSDNSSRRAIRQRFHCIIGCPSKQSAPRQQGHDQGFYLRVPAAGQSDYLNQWLAAHAAVVGDSLQPFELYGQPGSDLEIFTRLESGRCLTDYLSESNIDQHLIVKVGIAVANALTVMHTNSLVHGEVRADRVWVTDDGEVILLRDPSSAPRVPRADTSLSWLYESESAGGYAAPEFSNPSQMCTPATDIYSLGCLLFRLTVGRPPVVNDDIEQAIASQATETPAELTEAVQLGETGDPVLRVAAFATAKNPGARFATTQQIADALTAVQATLPVPTATPTQVAAEPATAESIESNQAAAAPTQATETNYQESGEEKKEEAFRGEQGIEVKDPPKKFVWLSSCRIEAVDSTAIHRKANANETGPVPRSKT